MIKIFILISLLLLANSSFAQTGIVTKSDLVQLLKNMPPDLQKKDWNGTVSGTDPKQSCGFKVTGADGKIHPEGLSIFIGDINNDGQEEYVLVSRCGGSGAKDSILEVFQKKGSAYVPLNFAKVLDKNGKDGSSMPMNVSVPFLSKLKGKTVMNFRNPNEQWTWEKDQIGEVEKP